MNIWISEHPVYEKHLCIILILNPNNQFAFLLDAGIKLGSPALQADALPSEPPGRHQINIYFKGGLVEMREEGRSRRGYNVTKSLEVVLTGAIFSLIRNTRHKRNGSQAGS